MEHDSQNCFDSSDLISIERNEFDVLSLCSDMENLSFENEEKFFFIINKIIDERKNSIEKIQNFLMKIKSKRTLLIHILLDKRRENSITIQRYFRFFTMRKLIKKINHREETNFSIVSSIKYVKHIDLKVYLSDNQFKIFPFEFCKLRKLFVLYIPRNICNKRVFKVNFIADGKIIIDPIYKADYDVSKLGMFYNILDFNKIEKFEKIQREDRERNLNFHRDKRKKKDETLEKFSSGYQCSSSENDLEESSLRQKSFRAKHSDLRLKLSNSEKFSFKNSAPYSSYESPKIGLSKNHRNSCVFSSPLKSILRSATSSRTNITKRVSFCENMK